MAKHRTRVGLHGRNDVHFTEGDYDLVRRARIETLKTMSHTAMGVYHRLRRENPKLEFIVRLFDDRISHGTQPAPAKFVARMVPLINQLKPFTDKFEIHNEPNHADGLEGWGTSDADARHFASWYEQVLAALKRACPWARFGFPGLALNHPHRDLEWLAICKDAVRASHWLGCHTYWQYGNMLSRDWGLRFQLYHERFPGKRIEITEFGNSTPGLSAGQMAEEYVRYYAELNKYWYVGSASAFIASSPDPAWAPFAWMQENGAQMPVVEAVGKMERRAVTVIIKRDFPETGKSVSGSFLDFYDRYGKAICGLPITDQIKEDDLPAQYFERIAMEQPQEGKIRLKPIGTEVLKSRERIADLEERLHQLSHQPLITVDEILQALSEQIALLGEQIGALQEAYAAAVKESGGAAGSNAGLAAELGEQIGELQKVREGLQAELETALKAKREEQTALISYLRARITTLVDEIRELEVRQSSPGTGETVTAVKPEIIDVITDLARHETLQYSERSLNDIVLLVIHHSAAPASVQAKAIAEYHVRHWDWPGIGYHFIVGADGTVYQVNKLETISYHASAVNPVSVGICFLGNFSKSAPPEKQLASGARLVAWLMDELSLGADAIQGHQEVMNTACPGKQWLTDQNWKGLLMDRVNALQPTEAAPQPQANTKPIYHYMLFWARNGTWDETNWNNAEAYVATFQPAVGFRSAEARQAEYVTIVGGQKGIPKAVEDWLKNQGCKVDRVAGTDKADTKRLFDNLVQERKRFLAFEE